MVSVLFEEMIGATRDIDRAWSDFEHSATNVHARSAITGHSTSSAALVSSIDQQEVSQTSSETINGPLLPANFDMKSVADEMSAIKRSITDLRNHAEEVRIQSKISSNIR